MGGDKDLGVIQSRKLFIGIFDHARETCGRRSQLSKLLPGPSDHPVYRSEVVGFRSQTSSGPYWQRSLTRKRVRPVAVDLCQDEKHSEEESLLDTADTRLL